MFNTSHFNTLCILNSARVNSLCLTLTKDFSKNFKVFMRSRKTCLLTFSNSSVPQVNCACCCSSQLASSVRAAGQRCRPPSPFLSTTPAGKALHPPPSTTFSYLTHSPPPFPLAMAQCTYTHAYCALVAVRTLILSCCCSPHSIRLRTATAA